jgi:hypothetical protein
MYNLRQSPDSYLLLLASFLCICSHPSFIPALLQELLIFCQLPRGTCRKQVWGMQLVELGALGLHWTAIECIGAGIGCI